MLDGWALRYGPSSATKKMSRTYTASGQPYVPPPGQQPYGALPAAGATAAAAPRANPDPTDSLPYPKQSLINLFSNK
jgi:hypothetical protein